MRIQRITLQNYKAFRSAEIIDVDGKNLLIYGTNGSGKSSLYHALYHLLQSSAYDQEQLARHFAADALNRNIFAGDDPSYVELVVGDDIKSHTYCFASEGAKPCNTLDDINLVQANQASDFINYRLLSSAYNVAATEHVDLFPLFRDEFFPYWTDLARNRTYAAWYRRLQDELRQLELDRVRRNANRYQAFQESIEEFNQALARQIYSLVETCNDFLQVYLLDNEPIEVGLDVRGAYLDPAANQRFVLHAPSIQIRLVYHGKMIDKPHRILNEARLTALALSLRFAAFENFLKDAPFKFLVLDDLLISLDMSLRMHVIKAILGEFSDYQLIMMTHDQSFFNFIRQNLNLKDGWLTLELYENKQNDQTAKPLIRTSQDALEKATDAFAQNEYETCAVHLRKKAEELIRIYFDPTLEELARFAVLENLSNALSGIETEAKTKLFHQFTRLMNRQDIDIEGIQLLTDEGFRGDGILEPAHIGRLNSFRRHIWQFVLDYQHTRQERQQQQEDLLAVAAKVQEIRSRVLNLGAHHTDEPIFVQELQQAIDTLKQFEQEIKKNTASS